MLQVIGASLVSNVPLAIIETSGTGGPTDDNDDDEDDGEVVAGDEGVDGDEDAVGYDGDDEGEDNSE